MELYRLVKSEFASRGLTFDHLGAELSGGRWNPKGRGVIYASENRALSLCEILVHAGRLNYLLDIRLSLIIYEIPREYVVNLPVEILPKSWNSFPGPAELQAFGLKLLSEGNKLAYGIPSVIVPDEYNFLIDPFHPHFNSIKKKIQPFGLDQRFRILQ